MPCPHKFLNHLFLETLDFQPTTLIIGTFNPAWPETNTARWFYGRTHDAHGRQNNNFWAVLPRLYGEESLIRAPREDWQDFCKRHAIAITDLIAGIDDADEANPEHRRLLAGYSDKEIAESFHRHAFVDVPALLAAHPAIRNIYLTRGATDSFWKRLWLPVQQYAARRGIRAETLLTPSGYASYQLQAHNQKNPGARIGSVEDYVLMRWREVWGRGVDARHQ